jgi:starch phosphorylase
MIRRLVAFSHEPEIRHRFVFVEDYDMALARALVQGADVWLNTPLRPLEASGTSGMKAVLNGALHCSVLDGWWAEAFSAGTGSEAGLPNGWAISSTEGIDDEQRRSELEADGLFELLEHQILPLFWDRDDNGLRRQWTARIRRSLQTLGPLVGAHRMVRDYVGDVYLPAAARTARLSADGWAGARELSAFRDRIRQGWPDVHIEEVAADEAVADLGSSRPVDAVVSLGRVAPEEAEVQLVTGRVGQTGELDDPAIVEMDAVEDLGDGRHRYRGAAPLDIAGRMGVTVRVVPRHRLLSEPVDFGKVAWAG